MASYPQRIPRPSSWRPGRPAPWAGLGGPSERRIGIGELRSALERHGLGGPPPRELSERAADVEIFDGPEARGALRHAAVLVALFEEQGQARVILTRRSEQLRSHTGEVSFPGGRLELGETPVDAALREAHEEIGLSPEESLVVGHLHPIVTLVSTTLVQPVVAVLEQRPALTPDPGEVDRVLDVALADLLAEGVFHEERWRHPEHPDPRSSDGSYPLWFFEIAGEMIWGATGRLLVDLLCMVLGVTLHTEL
jgi:8-oxo-dGTP pyrophosphatase MutT (NUDIX family)